MDQTHFAFLTQEAKDQNAENVGMYIEWYLIEQGFTALKELMRCCISFLWQSKMTKISKLTASYDMVLYEDGSTNRMAESLAVLAEVVATKWFENCPVITV